MEARNETVRAAWVKPTLVQKPLEETLANVLAIAGDGVDDRES